MKKKPKKARRKKKPKPADRTTSAAGDGELPYGGKLPPDGDPKRYSHAVKPQCTHCKNDDDRLFKVDKTFPIEPDRSITRDLICVNCKGKFRAVYEPNAVLRSSHSTARNSRQATGYSESS